MWTELLLLLWKPLWVQIVNKEPVYQKWIVIWGSPPWYRGEHRTCDPRVSGSSPGAGNLCNISNSRSRDYDADFQSPFEEVARQAPNRHSDRKCKKCQNLTNKQTVKLSRCFSRNKKLTSLDFYFKRLTRRFIYLGIQKRIERTTGGTPDFWTSPKIFFWFEGISNNSGGSE